MRYANKLDAEHAKIHDVARRYSMNQRAVQEFVLFEFAFRQSGSEMRTVHGNIEPLQDVRQRAQMVLVAVGEDDGGDVLAKLFQEFEVGNRNIDAVSALFGKAHARVENEHLVAVAHSHAIHPKLANAAERDDL